MEDLDQILKRVLYSRRLSAAQAARRSGLSKSTMSKILGGSDPRWSTVRRIFEKLEVRPEELFDLGDSDSEELDDALIERLTDRVLDRVKQRRELEKRE